VKKRKIARGSMDIINIQTEANLLKKSAGTAVVGRARIFEGEIGEVKIVYRRRSFPMASIHHRAESHRGYRLSDRPIDFMTSQWQTDLVNCFGTLIYSPSLDVVSKELSGMNAMQWGLNATQAHMSALDPVLHFAAVVPMQVLKISVTRSPGLASRLPPVSSFITSPPANLVVHFRVRR
jgi:hypothetical protein